MFMYAMLVCSCMLCLLHVCGLATLMLHKCTQVHSCTHNPWEMPLGANTLLYTQMHTYNTHMHTCAYPLVPSTLAYIHTNTCTHMRLCIPYLLADMRHHMDSRYTYTKHIHMETVHIHTQTRIHTYTMHATCLWTGIFFLRAKNILMALSIALGRQRPDSHTKGSFRLQKESYVSGMCMHVQYMDSRACTCMCV
jgi:hypothetical protein